MTTDDNLPLFSQPPTNTTTGSPGINSQAKVIGVAELNRRARNILEANLELLWVAGELSNVLRAASGHYYFSLKDDQAQVRCVLFRQRAATISFTPENGMQVEVRALPSLYEARGEFQLGVETMRRAGLGALYETYERLKARLAAAGMFADSRKKPLPSFPRAIGIVTSPQAAALRDVLTTLMRRAPMIPVILYPTLVQGANAASEIAAAIDQARIRNEVAVLIICRGGGSIEDLWSFNEETVARAILQLQKNTLIPVVSGVGHETDFTICDFVADQRAPTPTAAAELVSPDCLQLRQHVNAAMQQLSRALQRQFATLQQRLDHAAQRLLSPAERLARMRDRLTFATAQIGHALKSQLARANNRLMFNRQRFGNAKPEITLLQKLLPRYRDQLSMAMNRQLQDRKNGLDTARRNLNLLSPDQVLERGYSIVEYRGAVLRNASDVGVGDALSVRLANGRIGVQVTAPAAAAKSTTKSEPLP